MYRFFYGHVFSLLFGRSSTFLLLLVFFLGLIKAPFIQLFTFHVPVTKSALNLVTNSVWWSVPFIPLVDVCSGAFPLFAPSYGCPGLLFPTYPGTALNRHPRG